MSKRNRHEVEGCLIDFKDRLTMRFLNGKEETARITWHDGKMTFTGNMDKAAKVFANHVADLLGFHAEYVKTTTA